GPGLGQAVLGPGEVVRALRVVGRGAGVQVEAAEAGRQAGEQVRRRGPLARPRRGVDRPPAPAPVGRHTAGGGPVAARPPRGRRCHAALADTVLHYSPSPFRRASPRAGGRVFSVPGVTRYPRCRQPTGTTTPGPWRAAGPRPAAAAPLAWAC